MKKALLLFLIGILLAGCSARQEPMTHIYAFGGDLTNTENCLKIIQDEVELGEWEPDALNDLNKNWEGRLSNGPVAVEILADRMKVGLTSYAVCAARSDHGNLNDPAQFFQNTGLLGQIDKYEADLRDEKAEPGALYFIEMGEAIDIFEEAVKFPDDQAMMNIADQVVANIKEAVTRLARLGAKRFMVTNMIDWPGFPGIIYYGISHQAEVAQNRMNGTLPGEIEKLAQELDIQIDLFDFIAAGERIKNNADQYGLKDLTDPCRHQLTYAVLDCENPDEYYYWGDLYLTRPVHQAMGEMMADKLSK